MWRGQSCRHCRGTGNYSTAESIELSRQAEKIGVDAVMLVAPLLQQAFSGGPLPAFQSGCAEHLRSGHPLQCAYADGDQYRAADDHPPLGDTEYHVGQGGEQEPRGCGGGSGEYAAIVPDLQRDDGG